jgi:hypothetical protein
MAELEDDHILAGFLNLKKKKKLFMTLSESPSFHDHPFLTNLVVILYINKLKKQYIHCTNNVAFNYAFASSQA